MSTAILDVENRDLDLWRRIYGRPTSLELSAAAWHSIEIAAATLSQIVARKQPVYGVTTGFGSLAGQTIAADKLTELQHNLVLSNAVGMGEPLPDAVVRLAIAMKIAAIARGHSGVRRDVVEFFLRLLSDDALPIVPSQGSVGASGDLAPFAAISAVLLGYGRIRYRGQTLAAETALKELGLVPIELGPKEGLALLNGTQVSTALAMAGPFEAELAFRSAIVTGALTTEAVLGKSEAFDARLHAVRRQPGQIAVASAMRRLLAPSGFRDATAKSGRVQDPHCIRCQPQVMGAVLDLLRFAAEVVTREGDAVTDNPILFPDSGAILSGGNFHAEPIAFAADIAALALAEIGSLAERRIAMLVDSSLSGLPPFLTAGAGLHSGFMTAQIAAAALVAETRHRANPASIDNIPTVANQEDHVSMATHAARRLLEMAANVRAVLAIELLAAAEGCDHRGLAHGVRLQPLQQKVRQEVPSMARDRWFEPAFAAGRALIHHGVVADVLGAEDLAPLGAST